MLGELLAVAISGHRIARRPRNRGHDGGFKFRYGWKLRDVAPNRGPVREALVPSPVMTANA